MSVTPNALTFLRIALSAAIPLFVVANQNILSRLTGLALLSLAVLTDYWDGILARRRGLVTVRGQIMDPIADKILILTAMFSFVSVELYHVGFVLLILVREVAVTVARLIFLRRGFVVAAEKAGKWKTAVQTASILFSYLTLIQKDYPQGEICWNPLWSLGFEWINLLFLITANLLTLYSGMIFFSNNRRLFFAKGA
jgi:CDP-diacylglycerol--glycerol-3-phosphate 3-phosphatidyltransferase